MLMIFWGWFVTLVIGIAPISIVDAIGIVIVLSILTSQYIHISDESEIIQIAIYEIANPVFCLCIGLILHYLM